MLIGNYIMSVNYEDIMSLLLFFCNNAFLAWKKEEMCCLGYDIMVLLRIEFLPLKI